MNRVTLPPQAYTRETLSAALQWLHTQNEQTQKMADTPDALVALYLRAKRNGELTLENSAPVSTEEFRSTLKNLASELQQFSTTPEKKQMPSAPVSDEVKTSNATAPKSQLADFSFKGETPTASSPIAFSLDPKSRLLLQKTQERFNLSSESEALRLLLSIGFERLNSL